MSPLFRRATLSGCVSHRWIGWASLQYRAEFYSINSQSTITQQPSATGRIMSDLRPVSQSKAFRRFDAVVAENGACSRSERGHVAWGGVPRAGLRRSSAGRSGLLRYSSAATSRNFWAISSVESQRHNEKPFGRPGFRVASVPPKSSRV